MTHYIPIFISFVLVLIARASFRREIQRLDEPRRARFYSEFAPWRLIQVAGIALVLGLMMFTPPGPNPSGPTSPMAYVAGGVLLVWLVLGPTLMRAKLRAMELPSELLRAFVADHVVLGILAGMLIAAHLRLI